MSGGWRRPVDVGLVTEEEAVYLAHLPGGPIIRLEGSGALVWECALAGPADDLVDRVADAAGVEPDTVRDDVVAFVADLVAKGLLEPVP